MTTFIESEIKSPHYHAFDRAEELPSPYRSLLNTRNLIFGCLLLILCVLPFIIYLDMTDKVSSEKLSNICLIDDVYRVACGETNITQTKCVNIHCCFDIYTNSCYHTEPSSYYYYEDKTGRYVPSQNYTPLGLPSMKTLNFTMLPGGKILKIILNGTLSSTVSKISSTNFDIRQNKDHKLAFSVFRKDTGELLLTTLKGPLIFSQYYLDWTIQLTNTSGVLFGLNELKISLDKNTTLTKTIYKNQDDHNTLPTFMAYNNGKYHAVVIKHEGLLHITVLPSYLIYLRCISGRVLEVEIIDGPKPKDIYKKLKKYSPALPEWTFGVHICRENPAKNLDTVIEQYKSAIKKITYSYESECIHDDLFLHLLAENKTSEQIGNLFTSLNLTKNLMLSFPPHIPKRSQIYEKYKNGTFFTNGTSGNVFEGQYKGMEVVYPNYNHGDIKSFLGELKKLFSNTTLKGITFTNAWPQDDSYLVRNSPAPFIAQDILKTLSYTIPWNLTENKDIHMRYHNQYGPAVEQIIANLFKINNSVTLSSVSAINLRKPLILQNINASWTDLKKVLRITLHNSLFGYDLLATPVCGSTEFYDAKSQEDLCLRWYLMAATLPLLRISSQGASRDPSNLYSDYTRIKAIDVLEKRSTFISFFRAILNTNESIIRPMFYNFPNDENTHDLDQQYMIGDVLLVAQPMAAEIEILQIYLPPEITWYEFWGGQAYKTKKNKEWIKIPIVKSDWISFIAEGNIVAQVNKTGPGGTEIYLTVAMSCVEVCQAKSLPILLSISNQTDVPITFSSNGTSIEISSSENPNLNISDIRNMIKNIKFFNYTNSFITSDPTIVQMYNL